MLAIHTLFGFLSIGFALYVVFGEKGTPRHRRMGHGYFLSMIVLCSTGFTVITSDGFSIFHVLSFNGLFATTVGYAAVMFRARIRYWYYWHYHGMYWSVTGLFGGTMNEIIVHVEPLRLWVEALGTRPTIVTLQIAILVVAGWLIFKNQNATLHRLGLTN